MSTKLPAVERLMMAKALDMGLTAQEYIDQVLKDTPNKVFLSSTEIKAVYPVVYKCRVEYPVCRNAVTAHEKAYCDQFAPPEEQHNPVRCQHHITMAGWMRPVNDRGILYE